ncbi:hypothetical protein BCCGELA001_30705 [Bradyrhizobium sp. CCGE-LA001]|nr:hypothetical protein BCCGELA001_30705 [Bradyrhizobium sp. CCGE-LA001]
MDAIGPGRSIAAIIEPRYSVGGRVDGRILDQFGDHTIPGGHARTPTPRNCGGATSGIDDDFRKHELGPRAIACTTDDAAARRDADCAQPAEHNPGGDSLVAKALVETGAIDHIAEAAGMTQKVFVLPLARAAGSSNSETAPRDRRIGQHMIES